MIKHNEDYFSESVRHHLIDIVDPMDDFNVSHFKDDANKAIEDILSRGKLPIICGGTGFWINSIVYNMDFPSVEPDEELRSMLRNKPAEELFEMLSELDPDRAATIEKQNPVRLIRAIEIAKALGKVPNLQLTTQNSKQKYTFLQIGIDISREILNEKIKKRLDERFESGMLEEVENLHKNGVSWEWMEKIGLEYRWISRFLLSAKGGSQTGTTCLAGRRANAGHPNKGEKHILSFDEMREKLYFDIIHYAKRQITWLKKNKETIWLSDYADIEKATRNFLEN